MGASTIDVNGHANSVESLRRMQDAAAWTFVDVASGRTRGVPEHIQALFAERVPGQ